MIEKLSEPNYRSLNAINFSTLKKLKDANNEQHFKWLQDHPEKPTVEMTLGSAIHAVLLEPDSFEERFAIAPVCDKRTKLGKETYEAFLKENEGREIISEDDHETCMMIYGNLERNHELMDFLAKLDKEMTITWKDPSTAMDCKGKIDAMSSDGSILVDIKTTKCAKIEAFANSVVDFSYHMQAAFYLQGIRENLKTLGKFYFIAIDKTAPHCIALYELGEEFLQLGNREIVNLTKQYWRIKETGQYKGYDEHVQTINMPEWLKRKYEVK